MMQKYQTDQGEAFTNTKPENPYGKLNRKHGFAFDEENTSK
jgi:hypothetical protein